jgi:lipoprotein-anchoring transpeptidase ErfK/SrfK
MVSYLLFQGRYIPSMYKDNMRFDGVYPSYSHSYKNISSDPGYRLAIHTYGKKLDLFRNGKLYKTYPVSVGSPATPTPKGNFRIINKDDNPWGPQFGVKWLGLSEPHIGIHGTNHPESIGLAVSEGCIRMYNRDILELYYMLPLGTPVTID